MGLMKNEAKEWKSLKAKARKYDIKVDRIPGNSNVSFSEDVYAQLGTGSATRIIDAKIRLKKMKR